jgi:hybrid cluster-associated redox disulfide protein
MMKKITKKTKLSELMESHPETAEVLLDSGMGCFGCPMAMQETVEDGCRAHGMSDKDIDKLVDNLNKNKK